jgi:hypothetical protein
MTQPDIDYATTALAQFNSNPSWKHLLAAKGILHYLGQSKDFVLEFGGLASVEMYRMCDADWASDESSWISVSGYAFFVYGSLVL